MRQNKIRGTVAITLLLILFGCDEGKVTIYTADCNGTIESNVCKGKLILRPPATYRVNSGNHEVVWWVGDGLPDRMTNCAIKDAENWKCEYKSFGFPAFATMKNGIIQYLDGGMNDNGFVQISWSWYWYYKIFGTDNAKK